MRKRTNSTENGESHKKPRLLRALSSGEAAQGDAADDGHAVTTQPSESSAGLTPQQLQWLERLQVQFQHQQQQLLRTQRQATTTLHTQQQQQHQQLIRQHEKQGVSPEQRRHQIHQLRQRHEIALARLREMQTAKQQTLQRKQLKFLVTKKNHFQVVVGSQQSQAEQTPQPVLETPAQVPREVHQRVATSEGHEIEGHESDAIDAPRSDLRHQPTSGVVEFSEEQTTLFRAVEDVRRTSQADVTSLSTTMENVQQDMKQLRQDSDALSTRFDDEHVLRAIQMSRILDDVDRLSGTTTQADRELDKRVTSAMDAIRGLAEEACDKQSALAQLSAAHRALSTKTAGLEKTVRDLGARVNESARGTDMVHPLVDARLAELDTRLTQALNQQQTQIALTQQVIAMYDAAQRRVSELEEQLKQVRQLYEREQTSSSRQ